MNEIQTEFITSPNSAKSQEGKILAYLKRYEGQWVTLPTLVDISGSYAIATRISGLRKQGHDIINKVQRVDGQSHSFYCLQKAMP